LSNMNAPQVLPARALQGLGIGEQFFAPAERAAHGWAAAFPRLADAPGTYVLER